ncbi:hypothetical protein T05_9085 [Trichinella murrelli]|uniref:Uncharacterized protein n=1 Tax=Trichinella murrelli TaxID=144512 RepID=A0A0V0UDM4_9BILA|nr:hypothetical protein T05_9085 [Trichinella murrelli]
MDKQYVPPTLFGLSIRSPFQSPFCSVFTEFLHFHRALPQFEKFTFPYSIRLTMLLSNNSKLVV